MNRVGILGIQHESNTFLPEPTTLRHFQESVFLRGEEIRAHYVDAHHEVGGFFEGLAAAGVEAVPLFTTFAMPTGAVTDDALAELWKIAEKELEKAGPLDGMLVNPHGAAVNVSRSDMDGWWLGELRRVVGPGVPIIGVIDPHANLTPAMVAATDAMMAYRENPHIDQRQRGREAADLMAATLRGEIRPVVAGAFTDVAINIERQLTTAEPILSIVGELERVRARPGILSASLVMGYPYADVPEMGTSFLVVSDGDSDLAIRLAAELKSWLWENREQFRGRMISPDEALCDAESLAKPVALLDMGDNMGGGGTADSTVLAALCHARADGRSTYECLHDPESVRGAEAMGVGGQGTLRMGGKDPASPAPPLEAAVTVLGLYGGKYGESQPRHGGQMEFDLGATAVVKTATNLTIMLTTRRAFPASANQLLAFDLDPAAFDRIILKGVHSPVAGFAEHCPSMIRVNTPGVTTADMETLPYAHRRKPLFPFE
jgi:microcystin degradation protein MlrC